MQHLTDFEAMVARAKAYARYSHDGQFDYDGTPLLDRIEYSVERVEGHTAKTVAYLQFIVAYSDTTLTHLVYDGFPPEVIAAVDALTQRENEIYSDYIDHICENALASYVALASLGFLFERYEADRRANRIDGLQRARLAQIKIALNRICDTWLDT